MINELISHLIAIKEFSKDIHYTCHSQAFYGKHLLADRVQENIDGYIDDLKETTLLGNDVRPLASKEYLKQAIELIPEVKLEDDKSNFNTLQELITKTLELLDNTTDVIDIGRATNSILDTIASDLQKSKGLINLQLEE